MNIKYFLLGFILSFGFIRNSIAQNNGVPEEYQFSANARNSEVAGESKTLFTQKQTGGQKKSCSLLQNKWKQREIIRTQKGYKIITAGNDEIVEVKKRKDKVTKITYLNDFETLEYKVLKNGKTVYTYSYTNGCVNIKSRKNKKGIVSNTNKSDMSYQEVNENIKNAIEYAVNSCASI